jgi:hypothetical protein
MMRKLALFAAVLGAVHAVPAAAEEDPGKTSSEPLAIQAMHNFGRCVADRNPEAARKVLAMDFRTKESGKAVERLARGHNYCVPIRGKLAFSGILFAGGLAERLLEVGSTRQALIRQLAYDPAQPPVEARTESEAMAMCMVRRATGDVVALFGTTPATDEEKEAIGKLTPAVGQCLASGQTMRLNRQGLRSLLSLAAYRLTQIGGAPALAGS